MARYRAFFGANVAGVTNATGTIAQTLPKPTQALSGTSVLDATGTIAQTLPRLTQAATAKETITGIVAQTLPRIGQSASAKETISGVIAQTLAKITQTLAGTVTSTATSGTIAQTLPMLRQEIVGVVTNPAVVPPSAPAPAPGGITHRRKRRRILLDDGRIWVPATEEDFQDYIAALIRSFEAKLPLEPPPAPRKRRYKAAVKSLAEIPKLMLARPLPGGFYETLANNAADVLTSRMLADAWEAYAAEMDEDEAVTMLLLS